MTRRRLAEICAYVSAATLVGTAAWHQSAYTSVTTLAAGSSAALGPLVAVLWTFVGLALVLTAALVLVVARVGVPNRAFVLSIAALSPISGAALQLVHLGFIPPTALLLADGLLILLAVVLGHRRQSASAPAP